MKRPLVVKLGSALVLDDVVVDGRAADIAAAVREGTAVCVVSSGAVALGLRSLGVDRRPRSLPRLQAASALGQPLLQRRWEDAIGGHGVRSAQVLLTAAEIGERRAYVNARNTFHELHRIGVVPVVNENDATATDEISFGDNDMLAAQVAMLVRAELLVLLTSVEGVLDADAAVIAEGAAARTAVFGAGSAAGKGGMESKVAAAELAAAAGIPSVIASGKTPLPAVLAGGGTRFAAAPTGESAFKLWLRFGKRVTGRLIVDEGAERAVRRRGSSLLAVGVVRCDGAVRAGDGVELCGLDGTGFGRGISSLDARELEARPSNVEAVHRDRLILY